MKIKHLLLATAAIFFASLSYAQGGYEVNDELFGKYLNQVKYNAEASAQRQIDPYEFDNIAHSARGSYENNVEWDGRWGHYRTNRMLTHFIQEGLRFLRIELRYNPWQFRQRYETRRRHVVSCHACNGFQRQFFRYSRFRPLPFQPEYAYHNGRRLSCRSGRVSYSGHYYPIEYNYASSGWGFRYRGRHMPLQWM